MKKSLLILLLSSILFPIMLFAQADMEDVIYLKNGSVYRGTIIEQVAGRSYKIEIMGGSIISIAATDVDKVTREAQPYDPERSDARRGERGRHRKVKGEHYAKIEAAGSGLLLFRQPFTTFGRQMDVSGGGGVSFMAEVGRRGGFFTLVTGAAVQFLNLHNLHSDVSTNGYNRTLFDIGTGVQTRFQVPFLFRWTFGHQVPIFFQFGFSAGFSCYQGRGSETTASNYWGGVQPTRTYGWQKYYDGFFNVSSIGIGFKQKVNPSLDFIFYAEGSPGHLVITNNTVYQPYLELHAGVSFDAQRYRQARKGVVKF